MTIKEIKIDGTIGNQTFTVEIDTDTIIEVSIFDSNNGVLIKIVENETTLIESANVIDSLPILLPIRSYNLVAVSSSTNSDAMSIADFSTTLKMYLVQDA